MCSSKRGFIRDFVMITKKGEERSESSVAKPCYLSQTCYFLALQVIFVWAYFAKITRSRCIGALCAFFVLFGTEFGYFPINLLGNTALEKSGPAAGSSIHPEGGERRKACQNSTRDV